ncbi:MAG: hypothetical protein ACEPOZ_14205 [Marinifilaceae bacterium]
MEKSKFKPAREYTIIGLMFTTLGICMSNMIESDWVVYGFLILGFALCLVGVIKASRKI